MALIRSRSSPQKEIAIQIELQMSDPQKIELKIKSRVIYSNKQPHLTSKRHSLLQVDYPGVGSV